MLSKEMLTSITNWCQKRPFRLCILFGSQATGKTHPGSDVDLAIWLAAKVMPEQKLDWVTELATLLNSEVSLVVVSTELDPVLGFEIVKNGRILFERETALWLKERSRLWHAYNDSLPFRRAARKQLKQFAKEIQNGS